MSVFPFALVVLSLFAIQLCWVAFVSSMPQGRFRVLADTAQRFSFRSDCGEFVLHRDTGTLAWKKDGRVVSAKLADLRGVEYEVKEVDAPLFDLALGIDLTDIFRRYHDSVLRYEIAIVTPAHGRVQVFRSGRLQRREFLLGWWIEFEEQMLIRLGLIKDVERQARQALALLRARLGRGGA